MRSKPEHLIRTLDREQLSKEYEELRNEAHTIETKNSSLKSILKETIETIDYIVCGVRAIIYVATIGYLWWYLNNQPVAIGVTIALVFAHLTVWAREALASKKHDLEKI